jgi:hypothetical protein
VALQGPSALYSDRIDTVPYSPESFDRVLRKVVHDALQFYHGGHPAQCLYKQRFLIQRGKIEKKEDLREQAPLSKKRPIVRDGQDRA